VKRNLTPDDRSGIQWIYSPQTSSAPVYRFFNTVTSGHFFTISEEEKNMVLQTYPQFRFEGVGFYAFITD